MTISAFLLFAAQAATSAAPLDSITVELVTPGSSSGWTISADGKGELFDRSKPGLSAVPSGPQVFSGPAENFAFTRQQLAKYRALARDGAGCPVAKSDVFGFRLTWIETGQTRTATFTDSCGGIPDDLDAALRPIVARINPLLAAPPADLGSAEDR